MIAIRRVAAVLLVSAGCWMVWMLGGTLLALAGLDDLDLIGRTVLIFAFLTVCEAVHERVRSVLDPSRHH